MWGGPNVFFRPKKGCLSKSAEAGLTPPPPLHPPYQISEPQHSFQLYTGTQPASNKQHCERLLSYTCCLRLPTRLSPLPLPTPPPPHPCPPQPPKDPTPRPPPTPTPRTRRARRLPPLAPSTPSCRSVPLPRRSRVSDKINLACTAPTVKLVITSDCGNHVMHEASCNA